MPQLFKDNEAEGVIQSHADLLHDYYKNCDIGSWPAELALNTIYHGDALDGLKLIPTASVKLIVSDPPYFQGLTHNGQRGAFVDLAICKPFFRQLFLEYKRILRPDGECYFFCDWRGYAFYYPLFDGFLGARNVIVWDKQSGAGNFYAFQHEFILFHCVSPQTNKKGGNVWRSPGFAAGAKKTNGEKIHETQKTEEVTEKIILSGSRPGDLVLDTFAGSGTTGIVSKKTGRNFILFELDEDNFYKSVKRAGLPVQSGIFT